MVAFDDSDGEGYEALMLFGEFMLKLTVAGLLACVKPDKDRTRYSLAHRLVRANGLGDWDSALTELLTGTARQFLVDDARELANDLTRRSPEGSWQEVFSVYTRKALEKVLSSRHGQAGTGARSGWSSFVTLRNRTRAHGAITGGLKSEIAADVRVALEAYSENFGLFQLTWAYLKRNMSGKYRVTSLVRTKLPDELVQMRTRADAELEDGVYIYMGSPRHVELAASDPDFVDFFVANGRYTNQSFEMLSYLTGEHLGGDASKYMHAPGAQPKSETSGVQRLESTLPNGAVHNLPRLAGGYVSRPALEEALASALISQYPVTSLVGRGGIGKTSLALRVLHSDRMASAFDVIVWFSARDVDLMPHGPVRVQPDVLDVADVAKEFAALLEPFVGLVEDPLELLRAALRESPLGGPVLFVFDNFETVSNPRDLFVWLASEVRPPNKVLITSRSRDFDRDYRIPVEGMTAAESEELVKRTAREGGLEGRLTAQFIQSLHEASGGHPYIMKVLVGHAAKSGDFSPVRSILAPQEDLLTALFERTYSSLSPLARRVFLTLCSWNSPQSELCLEAVLARSTRDAGVPEAIAELERASLVELKGPFNDDSRFLVVPLAGYLFGESKLQASPERLSVHADREVLMMFGAVQSAEMNPGAVGRAEAFLRTLSRRSEAGNASLDEYADVLEYVARRVPAVWKLLSAAYEESLRERNIELAIQFMRRYLESSPSPAKARSAWERVAHLCRVQGDIVCEVHAIAEYCSVPDTWREKISDGMLRVTQILADPNTSLDRPDRLVFVRKLISSFEPHVQAATATELSRMAWLHLYLGEEGAARRVVAKGLKEDGNNFHVRNLADRLGMH